MSKTIIMIMGPSGSGKSTLETALLEGRTTIAHQMKKVVSVTTRQPRDGETAGTSYYYHTEAGFDELDLIQMTNYVGHRYGSTLSEFKTFHNYVLFVVTPDSAATAKDVLLERLPEGTRVRTVWFDISTGKRAENMHTRGDSNYDIETRISQDTLVKDFAESGIEPDFVVTDDMLNDKLPGVFTDWLIKETEVYKKATDYWGNPINVGSIITYPVRRGSNMWLNTAIVVEKSYGEPIGYPYPRVFKEVLHVKAMGERFNGKTFEKYLAPTRITEWSRAIITTIWAPGFAAKFPMLIEEQDRLMDSLKRDNEFQKTCA